MTDAPPTDESLQRIADDAEENERWAYRAIWLAGHEAGLRAVDRAAIVTQLRSLDAAAKEALGKYSFVEAHITRILMALSPAPPAATKEGPPSPMHQFRELPINGSRDCIYCDAHWLDGQERPAEPCSRPRWFYDCVRCGESGEIVPGSSTLCPWCGKPAQRRIEQRTDGSHDSIPKVVAREEAKCATCGGHGGDGGQSQSGQWEFPCEDCSGTGKRPDCGGGKAEEKATNEQAKQGHDQAAPVPVRDQRRATPARDATGHAAGVESGVSMGPAQGAPPSVQEVEAGHPHLVDGEFQSDKYPTCPRGKVPLSTKDTSAQDLLWEYAQRRRAIDAEFAVDLEIALKRNGYNPPNPLTAEAGRLTREDDELAGRVREGRMLLHRLVKYARKDRAETPGSTRLGRLVETVDDYLRRTANASDILRATALTRHETAAREEPAIVKRLRAVSGDTLQVGIALTAFELAQLVSYLDRAEPGQAKG